MTTVMSLLSTIIQNIMILVVTIKLSSSCKGTAFCRYVKYPKMMI